MINTALGAPKTQTHKMLLRLLMSAESDEVLLRKAIKTQVKHIRIPAGQYNAREIPINVATPFPPLNLSHIGKQCPKKELKAAI